MTTAVPTENDEMTRSSEPPSSDASPAAVDQAQLWIDGCGGFVLLPGSRWTIGGMDLSGRRAADIRVGADLPRMAGRLDRSGQDYFWVPREGDKTLIDSQQPVPLPGSASLWLTTPSPLSGSALLTLRPPHRFADHVDGVILVSDTVLIGPGVGCHVRCELLQRRWTLTQRNQTWVMVGPGRPMLELVPGQRVEVDEISLTLVKG
ncbi:hypothetical protein Pan14r_43880 [Crateriforma conspicua]|uniref:Uncharacterized protein n=2 Tax=Crateriforma conspicua TaxID=2527996 RepID=A0A5C5YC90_9PLAN|nr:hypothetical protein Mal65_08050 [Crateriforma conspicua]TWT72071.1 hypothetical protein Pan14r_43880 [Crateriforma conspicua]